LNLFCLLIEAYCYHKNTNQLPLLNQTKINMFNLFSSNKANSTTPLPIDTIVAGTDGQTRPVTNSPTPSTNNQLITSNDSSQEKLITVNEMDLKALMQQVATLESSFRQLMKEKESEAAAKKALELERLKDNRRWKRIPALFQTNLPNEPHFDQAATLDYLFHSASKVSFEEFNKVFRYEPDNFTMISRLRASQKFLNQIKEANGNNVCLLNCLATLSPVSRNYQTSWDAAKTAISTLQKLEVEETKREFLCHENNLGEIVTYVAKLNQYIKGKVDERLVETRPEYQTYIGMERTMIRAAALIRFYRTTLKQLKGEKATGSHAWYQTNQTLLDEHQKKRSNTYDLSHYEAFFLQLAAFSQLTRESSNDETAGRFQDVHADFDMLVENIVDSLTHV